MSDIIDFFERLNPVRQIVDRVEKMEPMKHIVDYIDKMDTAAAEEEEKNPATVKCNNNNVERIDKTILVQRMASRVQRTNRCV